MEPRAARLRRRAGPRGEQESRPSRGGEPLSGRVESLGGVGRGGTLLREACCPPAILPAVLGGQRRQTLASAPNHPAGRGKSKGTFRALALPCLSDSLTSEGEWSGFLFPGYSVSSNVVRLPAC